MEINVKYFNYQVSDSTIKSYLCPPGTLAILDTMYYTAGSINTTNRDINIFLADPGTPIEYNLSFIVRINSENNFRNILEILGMRKRMLQSGQGLWAKCASSPYSAHLHFSVIEITM